MVGENDYFSWNNLNELVGLNEHIEYAKNIIDKYDWANDVKAELNNLLKIILDKQNDEKLNLSVIGDFSTGKSSFINALLRIDFLEVRVIQGTTTATSVIEYSPDCIMKLKYKNGRTDSRYFNNTEELKEEHKAINNNGILSESLETLTVNLPSENLKKGFRIIDTPGTNATERWHEDVTRRALRDLSDMSIIITDITQPLAATTCNFVSENLENILDKCIIVATKLDTVNENEWDDTLAYIRARASREFGVEMPVLGYSSKIIMENHNGNGDNSNPALAASLDSERRIFHHVSKYRALSQCRKQIDLFELIYNSASEQLEEIKGNYERELELLTRSKQTDLSQFIQEQKDMWSKEFFHEWAQVYLLELKNTLEDSDDDENTSEIAVNDIYSIIDNAATLENLKKLVSTELSSCCKEEAEEILDAYKKEIFPIIVNDVIETYNEAVSAFNNEFKNKFNDLDIINYNLENTDSIQIPTSLEIKTSDLGSANAYISEQLSNENKAYFGGMAAGAIAGTAIAPGIGTVIGAVIGGIAGGLFAPDVGKVKSDLKSNLKNPLKKYFNEMLDIFLESVANYMNSIEKCIDDTIDNYLARYKSFVDDKIRSQENRRGYIENSIRGIKDEQAVIIRKKDSLNRVVQEIQKKTG